MSMLGSMNFVKNLKIKLEIQRKKQSIHMKSDFMLTLVNTFDIEYFSLASNHYCRDQVNTFGNMAKYQYTPLFSFGRLCFCFEIEAHWETFLLKISTINSLLVSSLLIPVSSMIYWKPENG